MVLLQKNKKVSREYDAYLIFQLLFVYRYLDYIPVLIL